eukprot:TRINITY_DN37329_c0_g1_i2.p1 TRINITY_DN37329_c0_g1~~TRINITY_DN37329_c0_g1_i2.p1  ORF type:complete len:184 (+),score=34.60 TRINITY_DN37329_c0_g1_i2:89-640(+)
MLRSLVGSEMCIRDRSITNKSVPGKANDLFSQGTFHGFCGLQLLITGTGFVLLLVLVVLHIFLVCRGITTQQFMRRRYAEEMHTPLDLPEGWIRILDSNGNEYFCNQGKGISQWELPDGCDYVPSRGLGTAHVDKETGEMVNLDALGIGPDSNSLTNEEFSENSELPMVTSSDPEAAGHHDQI